MFLYLKQVIEFLKVIKFLIHALWSPAVNWVLLITFKWLLKDDFMIIYK